MTQFSSLKIVRSNRRIGETGNRGYERERFRLSTECSAPATG